SVLRPAAYCGVVGLKPTHGRISAMGVTPLAWSLDHVGVLCRSVEDAALALGVMAGHDLADPHSVAMPVDDYVRALDALAAPRVGVLRPLLAKADAANGAQIEATVEMLRKSGAQVDEAPLAPSFEGIHVAGDTTVRAEAAAFHRDLYAKNAADYPKHLGEAVKAGLATGAVAIPVAQPLRGISRGEMRAIAAPYAALVSRVAAGPAPKGLESTGEPYFCAPWSSAGMPSISLPTGVAPDGLPFAMQLTGA